MDTTRRSFVSGVAAAGALAASTGFVGLPAAAQASETKQAAESDQPPWEVCPEDLDESLATETIERDVVIVGLGSSGSYCATSCVENGLSVAVIERTDTFCARGGSHFVFNSSVQKEKSREVDVDLAVKDFLNIGNFKQNSRNVWTWAQRSGEAADWFAEVVKPYGLYPVPQHYDEEPITCIYPGTIMFIGGENEPVDVSDNDPYNGDLGLKFVPEVDLLSALQDNMESKGAEIYFNHTCLRLVKDGARVAGVIAQDADGTLKKFIGTHGVVVASGSIDADPDMFAYYCPTISHNAIGKDVPLFNAGTGDGIKQAIWAGASFQPLADCPPMIFWGSTNCIKNVLVNKDGVRFADENMGQSNMAAAQLHQRDGVMFALWNDAYADQLPAVSYRADDPSFCVTPEQLRIKWEGLIEAGTFIKANTLEEIAAAYDLPAEQLEKTVERYNAFCEQGVDEDFHKNPATLHRLDGPFYATAYSAPACLAVMGGVHVNERSQALTREDEPIEGLYVIGLAAGDFYANQYSTRFAGNSLGRNLTFGYLVGRQLAGLE